MPEEKLTPTEMTHLLLGLICERLHIDASDIALASEEVLAMKEEKLKRLEAAHE